MQLTDTLSQIANGLLVIALPIVIIAAIQHIRVMTRQLRSKLNTSQQQTVDRIVSLAVKAAEQMGGIKGLIGAQKQQEAINIAQKFLAEYGIKMDVGSLVDLIEAQVQTQFNSPTPVVDTAQTRQALIDAAVQTAVQAAEQSGLTGLIQNVGQQKKTYALQMAGQYLGQYGIKIDPQLLSGLIESQVLLSKQYLQAPTAQQTQAPHAAHPLYSPTTGLQPGG